MTGRHLEALKKWFTDYSGSFSSPDVHEQDLMTLKVRHTREVCRNILAIAKEQSLPPEKVLLSEAVALLHDVGRFPQFAKYKTFRDSVSVNHGKLGAEVLKQHDVLGMLNSAEQDLVLNAVRFHNAYGIPASDDTELIFFLKMIRDADKLDIWRVFLELYESGDREMIFDASQQLPDVPEYSDEAISAILNERMVPISALKTLNDFKLMQLSWVFDLNFRTSSRILIKRDYIRKIVAFLPASEDIRRAALCIAGFAERAMHSAVVTKG